MKAVALLVLLASAPASAAEWRAAPLPHVAVTAVGTDAKRNPEWGVVLGLGARTPDPLFLSGGLAADLTRSADGTSRSIGIGPRVSAGFFIKRIPAVQVHARTAVFSASSEVANPYFAGETTEQHVRGTRVAVGITAPYAYPFTWSLLIAAATDLRIANPPGDVPALAAFLLLALVDHGEITWDRWHDPDRGRQDRIGWRLGIAF